MLAWYGAPRFSVRLNPASPEGLHFEVIRTQEAQDGSAADVTLIAAFADLDEAEEAADKQASLARTLSVLSLFRASDDSDDE